MKTTKSIFASLALAFLLSVSAFAQTDSRVIAVVNKADWCHVCKSNGERAMAAFMNSNMDDSVQFIENNLTDEATKKQSAEALAKVGLDKVMADYKGTGMVYFFNSDNKSLITQISVARSNSELAEAVASSKKDM